LKDQATAVARNLLFRIGQHCLDLADAQPVILNLLANRGF
jgi:hypothetical protein